jgi:hypothetical protein
VHRGGIVVLWFRAVVVAIANDKAGSGRETGVVVVSGLGGLSDVLFAWTPALLLMT